MSHTQPPRRIGVVGRNGPVVAAIRASSGYSATLFQRKSPPDIEREGIRLVVVDATIEQEPGSRVHWLRRTFPLVDVLVYRPRASGAMVRDVWRAGAADVVLTKGELLTSIDRVLDDQQLLPRVEQLTRHRARGSRFEGLLSRNNQMWDLFEVIVRIAPTEATALIQAETGSGKELLARAIHRRSERSGRFVAVNCGSLPPQLAESELVGHEAGAFTGAQRARSGVIRAADRGTLFLDEIGDMPEQAQTSLLRFLQEGTVRPVGGHREEAADVRVVAATNVDLENAVAEGKFRADLFYRLDVIRLSVPPLRQRREDIVFLFGHFVGRLSRHYKVERPTVSDGFLDALVEYDWPGNVRELENFSERLVLGKRRKLTRGDFQRLVQRDTMVERVPVLRAPEEARLDTSRSLADNLEPPMLVLERRYLERVLRENAGRIADSARQAGISRRTLLRKLRAHGLEKADFKHSG